MEEASDRPAPFLESEPVEYGGFDAAFAEPSTPTAAESDPEPTHLTAPESVPASHLITPIHSTFVPPPPMPAAEFEPTEASASHRVDVAPPQEYRQSAPPVVLESAAFGEPEAQAEDQARTQPTEHFAAPIETDPADLHSVSPELRSMRSKPTRNPRVSPR